MPLFVTLPLQAIVWQLPLQAAVTQSPSQEVEHPALLHALAHPLHVVVPVRAGVLDPSLPELLSATVPALLVLSPALPVPCLASLGLAVRFPGPLDMFPTCSEDVGVRPVVFIVAPPPQFASLQFSPQSPLHTFAHEFVQSSPQ